jgi:DNA-binding HxlR family transcriptional regulator
MGKRFSGSAEYRWVRICAGSMSDADTMIDKNQMFIAQRLAKQQGARRTLDRTLQRPLERTLERPLDRTLEEITLVGRHIFRQHPRRQRSLIPRVEGEACVVWTALVLARKSRLE